MSWEDILKRGRRPVKKPERRAEERFRMSKPRIISREERQQQMKESKEQIRTEKRKKREKMEEDYPVLKEYWRHSEAWMLVESRGGSNWSSSVFRNATMQSYEEFMDKAKDMKLLKYNLKSVPKDILYEYYPDFKEVVDSLEEYLKRFKKDVDDLEDVYERFDDDDLTEYEVEQLEEKKDGLEAMKAFKQFYRKYLG